MLKMQTVVKLGNLSRINNGIPIVLQMVSKYYRPQTYLLIIKI